MHRRQSVTRAPASRGPGTGTSIAWAASRPTRRVRPRDGPQRRVSVCGAWATGAPLRPTRWRRHGQVPARERVRTRAPGRQHPAVPQGVVVDHALRRCGCVWSNLFLWRCESARGTYGAATETPMGRLLLGSGARFARDPEDRPAPSLLRGAALVPAGPVRKVGSRTNRLPGQRSGARPYRRRRNARARSGRRLRPPDRQRAPTVALDLSGLGGSGESPVVGIRSGESYLDNRELPARPGEVTFEVPGRNAGGDDDWVLLVEVNPR